MSYDGDDGDDGDDTMACLCFQSAFSCLESSNNETKTRPHFPLISLNSLLSFSSSTFMTEVIALFRRK